MSCCRKNRCSGLIACSILAADLLPVRTMAYGGNDVPDYQAVSLIIALISLPAMLVCLVLYVMSGRRGALQLTAVSLFAFMIALVLLYTDKTYLGLLGIAALILALLIYNWRRNAADNKEWQRVLDEAAADELRLRDERDRNSSGS